MTVAVVRPTMALDVEVPDPPALRGPQTRGEYEAIDTTDERPDDDYRRAELASFLREGAWADAFEEWAGHTALSADEFETVRDRELIAALDFYWIPSEGDVGYRAPALSDAERDAFEDPDGIETELDSLARVVSETLENDYLLREDDEFGFFAEEYTGDEPDKG